MPNEDAPSTNRPGIPQDPVLPPPPEKADRTVTEAYAEAADEMEALRDELQDVLDAARRAAEGGGPIPLQLATWITGGVNPFLDFTDSRKTRGPQTRLDLLRKLGRQFAGTGARVAID